METVKLTVKHREESGSPAARRLRRSGLVPGVMYGLKEEARPLSVPEKVLRDALAGHEGEVLLSVTFEGEKEKHLVMLAQNQRHHLQGHSLHIDLRRVNRNVPVQASVAISLEGEPQGVVERGVLMQNEHEVTVEALPTILPEHISIDVSQLNIGDHVSAGELQLPEGVTLISDVETVIASVTVPTVVKEPTEEEAEGEEEAGTDDGEGKPEGHADEAGTQEG